MSGVSLEGADEAEASGNRYRPLLGLFSAIALVLLWMPALAAGEARPSSSYADSWEFNFTSYSWFMGIDGDVTIRGHSADLNKSFIDLVEESDSFMALMGYVEARRGRLGLFTDVVWGDLGFPAKFERNGTLARFPRATLAVRGKAQLDYDAFIVQPGAHYEIAKWSNGSGVTAIDLSASARYWNQEADLSLKLSGTLDVDFDRLGLKFNRARSVAIAKSGTLEWVDPVAGARLRHSLPSGSELVFVGDVGGFGAGSEFSWQAVATYAFDLKAFGRTFRTVAGYRALSVDYSESTPSGKTGIDWIQHGPIVGSTLRW